MYVCLVCNMCVKCATCISVRCVVVVLAVPPECLNSLGEPKRLLFTNLGSSKDFENLNGYAIIGMSHPMKVTGLMVKAPVMEKTGEDGVTLFTLKHRDRTSSPYWTQVVTHSGNMKV